MIRKNIGVINEAGKYEDALRLYNILIEEYDEDPHSSLYFGKARCLKELGRVKEAEELQEKAEELERIEIEFILHKEALADYIKKF